MILTISYSKKLRLSKKAIETRLEFAKRMKVRPPNRKAVMFTDECSFWKCNMKLPKLWTADLFKEEGTGVHGITVHCWRAITSEGPLPIQIFTHNLDGEGLVKILDRVRPSIEDLNIKNCIFQQDNRKCILNQLVIFG